MIIELSNDGVPRLTDVERLDRLHAISDDPRAAQYDELCQPGDDDDHVWIDVARLRDAGLAASDAPDFGDRFDAMIAYAATKGWLDESGTRVRAHIQT
jgi:hypothetical protein